MKDVPRGSPPPLPPGSPRDSRSEVVSATGGILLAGILRHMPKGVGDDRESEKESVQATVPRERSKVVNRVAGPVVETVSPAPVRPGFSHMGRGTFPSPWDRKVFREAKSGGQHENLQSVFNSGTVDGNLGLRGDERDAAESIERKRDRYGGGRRNGGHPGRAHRFGRRGGRGGGRGRWYHR